MPTETTDVIVIGAGPAGSVAATKLQKEGCQVIVLEKTQFPRFVIGESLLPHCMDFLDELGMLDAIKSRNFQLKTGASFFNDNDVCQFLFSDQFTEGWDHTYQVKRADFDETLIRFAEEKGVDVRFNATVTSFRREDDYSFIEYEDIDGVLKTIKAKFVIDASGYGRVLPRLLNLTVPTASKSRGAVYSHFQDLNKPEGAADNIYIHAFNDNKSWVWSIPFSDKTASVGVVGDVEFVKECSENDGEGFLEIVRQFPFLKDRYHDSEMLEPIRANFNYSASVSSLYGDGFVLCGNATEFLDPVFSSGVTLAIASGYKAAELTKKHLDGVPVNWKHEYEDYLLEGIDVFRTYVNAWYDGSLQTIFFAKNVNEEYKKQICSVLAGYVWDKKNPFVKNHKRVVNSLAKTIKIQEH